MSSPSRRYVTTNTKKAENRRPPPVRSIDVYYYELKISADFNIALIYYVQLYSIILKFSDLKQKQKKYPNIPTKSRQTRKMRRNR